MIHYDIILEIFLSNFHNIKLNMGKIENNQFFLLKFLSELFIYI